MSKRKPENRADSDYPVTEKDIAQVKQDLLPLGLDAAMLQLERIHPSLHSAIRQRSLEAVGALDHLRLAEKNAREVRNAVEWAALVLVEAQRRSTGAMPKLPGRAASRGNKSRKQRQSNRTITAYVVALLHMHAPRRGATPDTSLVGFTLERGQGIADHIALTYPSAIRLVSSLIGSLLEGGCAEAIATWGHGQPERGGLAPETHVTSKPMLDNLPKPVDTRGCHSDGLVDHETLTVRGAQLRKLGPVEALKDLAATEPALAQYVTDQVHRLLESLVSSRVPAGALVSVGSAAKLMVLTAIQSMRVAHFALWRDMSIGTRLVELDPGLLTED